MLNLEKIGKYQLAAAIILFEIGSVALFELGIGAKQDAWLAVLSGMCTGLLLMWVYLSIQHREPEKNLIQILLSYLGRYIGGSIAFLYVVHFAYQSMRNTRDFGDLILITIMPQTPIFVVMLVLILLSSYAIFKGIEVFFRTLEFLFPFAVLGYFSLIIMFFVSGVIEAERILPILENGVRPVLKEAIPNILMVPFGQMALFLMFWKHLSNKNELTKMTMRSYVFVGLFLVMINWLNLVCLGVPLTSISTIPLLHCVRLIQIADFLERFDPVVVLLLFIGLYAKMTAYYLGAVLALSQLLHIDYKKVMWPVGAAIFSTSFIPSSYIQHIWIGFKISHNTDFVLFQAIIPILLLLVMAVRGRRKQA
ncbi:GerAB/ArcD/ProY family transporter [Ammoniphilus sp. 3BR4]|uniref:GerAB/ArcD/ProY family transporter n=1 Tax=Ammoniphilus sp. 3BR4 TaxID=3158265 RepID=UPI003467A34D